MHIFHLSSIRCLLKIAAFMMLGLLVMSTPSTMHAADRSPSAPGSISGMITNSSDEPLEGILVRACVGAHINCVASLGFQTVTTADGTYRIGQLGAAVYTLVFIDPHGIYAYEYYEDTQLPEAATEIPVAGNAVSGVSAILDVGGTIEGDITLYRASTIDYGGPRVSVYSAEASAHFPLEVYTIQMESGETRYRTIALPLGTYYVCASAIVQPVGQVLECYDDYGTDFVGGDPVAVQAGSVSSEIDIELGESARYAKVSGVVTGPDGAPVEGITVTPYFAGAGYDPPQPSYPFMPPPTETDAQGRYSFTTLKPSTYTFYFSDTQSRYLPKFYANASSLEQATLLDLGEGEERSDVNAPLAHGGQITGHVFVADSLTPDSARVTVYGLNSSGDRWTRLHTVTAEEDTGMYFIGGLTTGTYRLEAQGCIHITCFARFYEDAESVEDATDVLVEMDEITTIDVELLDELVLYEGEISGRVTTDGVPQSGIRVNLYSHNQSLTAATVYTYTNASGRYVLGGLYDGEYYVGFSDPQGTFAATYYADQPVLGMADVISVQGRTTVEGVNGHLVKGGALSGHVHTADGGALPNGQLQIYMRAAADWYMAVDPYAIELTADGAFAVRGLMPGRYHICYFAWATPNFAPGTYTCYGGTSPQLAFDVFVAAEETTEDIEFVLDAPTNPTVGPMLFLPMTAVN